jgi:hypothetical protein
MDGQEQITVSGEKSSCRPLAGGRPTKFTPEAVRQIRNLIERGKTREEIAELIGVTVGSLQVTCSRLGISLRRRCRRRENAIAAPIKQAQAGTPHQGHMGVDAKFALSLRYHGYERVLALPFTDDIIRQLALEAGFRNMTIGELLAELIMAITKKNLVRQVLEGEPNPSLSLAG